MGAGGGTGAEVLGDPLFVCFGLFHAELRKEFTARFLVSMNATDMARQLNNRNLARLA